MSDSQAAAAEMLRQMIQGEDFESAAQVLKSVTAEKAVIVPANCPYSIATNVAHTEQWQRRWLNQLQGLPALDIYRDGKDFPVVAASEWTEWRERFIDGIEEAYAIASAEPFVHHSRDDEDATEKLTKIALHGTYHLGQIKLLKRVLYAQTKIDRQRKESQ